MVSICSFKSYVIQNDAHFVNFGPNSGQKCG